MQKKKKKKKKKEKKTVSKELSQSRTFLSKQFSTNGFYVLNRSITSGNKKLLQEVLKHKTKKLSSLTRNCNLPTFTAKKTITNLTHYKLYQQKYDLLKTSLYFSFQLDKI